VLLLNIEFCGCGKATEIEFANQPDEVTGHPLPRKVAACLPASFFFFFFNSSALARCAHCALVWTTGPTLGKTSFELYFARHPPIGCACRLFRDPASERVQANELG
jgi:hypothetical protein